MNELRKKEERISYRTLAVHGDDLMKIGLSGKQIGVCLEFLLSAVLDGELPNEKSALTKAAQKKIAEDQK